MKTKNSSRLALCGAVALITQAAFAQSWQTVDDSVAAGGMTVAQAITKDPAGNLYSAGYACIDGANLSVVAVVRKSSDGGATWSTVDSFSNGEANPGYEYNAITSDAAGTLYAVGDNFWFSPYPSVWMVRKSTDGGANWTTTAMIAEAIGPGGTPAGIAADAAGNVYVAGYTYNPGPHY